MENQYGNDLGLFYTFSGNGDQTTLVKQSQSFNELYERITNLFEVYLQNCVWATDAEDSDLFQKYIISAGNDWKEIDKIIRDISLCNLNDNEKEKYDTILSMRKAYESKLDELRYHQSSGSSQLTKHDLQNIKQFCTIPENKTYEYVINDKTTIYYEPQFQVFDVLQVCNCFISRGGYEKIGMALKVELQGRMCSILTLEKKESQQLNEFSFYKNKFHLEENYEAPVQLKRAKMGYLEQAKSLLIKNFPIDFNKESDIEKNKQQKEILEELKKLIEKTCSEQKWNIDYVDTASVYRLHTKYHFTLQQSVRADAIILFHKQFA